MMRGTKLYVKASYCAMKIFCISINNLYFLKEDYYVREKICKILTLSGSSI